MRWMCLVGAGLTVACGPLPRLIEVDAGSCPDSIDNRWPSAAATAAELPEVLGAAGFREGEVPPDFGLVDQFGDVTCLRQFVGRYVVLDASALWCDPCRDVAQSVACVREALGEPLVYITLINGGTETGGPPESEDPRRWAEAFELDLDPQTPVLGDPGLVYTSQFPGDSVPSFLLLDPEQRVVRAGAGKNVAYEIEDWLSEHLDRSTAHCEELRL